MENYITKIINHSTVYESIIKSLRLVINCCFPYDL
ncbi:unnamed protein product [Brassica rapa subsp. trilocularis]